MDDLLNIDILIIRISKVWLIKIYQHELQLNKANASDTEAPFCTCLFLNGFVSTNIYDKRDDFDIVNVPFLDGDAQVL